MILRYRGIPIEFNTIGIKENQTMSETVKVDGIVLTRQQVEKAYKELNSPPKLEELVGGDIVEKTEGSGKRYVVVSDLVGAGFARTLGTVPLGLVRVTDGKETWSIPRRTLRKVGWLKGSGKPA